MQFKVNEPDVVFEVFDEEVVIVNLGTGTYYSLREGGPAVWHGLVKGVDADVIERAYAARSSGESDAAKLREFIEELVGEELLRPDEAGQESQEFVLDDNAPLPLIERFSEMQDLLALDPVHEVDPKGWPVAKDA